MRDIRPLTTEADYEWALCEVERYFDDEPALGSPEADRFNVLVALIEAYENKHWQVDAPDPIAAIETVMAERGYSVGDLADVLGSASRASEILKRRRPLNLRMIQQISERWRMPADVLIAPYHLDNYAPTLRSA